MYELNALTTEPQHPHKKTVTNHDICQTLKQLKIKLTMTGGFAELHLASTDVGPFDVALLA